MEYDNLGRMTKQTDLYSDLVTQWFYDMDRLEGTSAGLSYEDEDARVRKSYFYNENNYLIREITMPESRLLERTIAKALFLGVRLRQQ